MWKKYERRDKYIEITNFRHNINTIRWTVENLEFALSKFKMASESWMFQLIQALIELKKISKDYPEEKVEELGFMVDPILDNMDKLLGEYKQELFDAGYAP